MSRYVPFGALIWLLFASLAPAQEKRVNATAANRIALGRLETGAVVVFFRAGSGDWGIEIFGDAVPRMTQKRPAQIEVFRGEENVRQLDAGYQSVQKETDTVLARAKVAGAGAAEFAVEDRWKISGAVLLLSRRVSVTGPEDKAGFYSAIRFSTTPAIAWPHLDYLAPGLLYGEPHAGGSAPGGTLNYGAKRFSIREDYLPAPVFALSFRDGRWAAVMDLAPRGDTSQAETTAPAATPIIDESLQFGALGAREVPEGGVEFGSTPRFARQSMSGRTSVGGACSSAQPAVKLPTRSPGCCR